MKTYLLTLMLVLTSCLACQPTASAQTKHNESISKEQFRKKQRDFIIREARLSPKEASYFFPLFFELQDKKKLLTDDADAKRKKALEEKLDEKQYKSAVDQILSNKKIFSIMMAEMKFRKQLIKNTRQEQR